MTERRGFRCYKPWKLSTVLLCGPLECLARAELLTTLNSTLRVARQPSKEMPRDRRSRRPSSPPQCRASLEEYENPVWIYLIKDPALQIPFFVEVEAPARPRNLGGCSGSDFQFKFISTCTLASVLSTTVSLISVTGPHRGKTIAVKKVLGRPADDEVHMRRAESPSALRSYNADFISSPPAFR